MPSIPLFSEAMVLAPDPKAPGLRVVLASGQVPSLPVKVGHQGAADGVAVDQKPLPRPGTWGLCCFPGGDNRNGVWICSLYLAQQDAYTSETDPNIDFQAHYSGAFEMLDGEGRWTKSFPDGSFIQVSDSTTKPILNRHIVDTTQTRQMVPFPDSERIAAAPSARNIMISHTSGTNVHIDPTGNITTTGAAGATFMVSFNGATIDVSATGTITLTDKSGCVISLPNTGTVMVTGNLVVSGDISDQNGDYGTLAMDRTKYNAHEHQVMGVMTGTSTVTTGVTTMPWDPVSSP